jgi:hypothetical protein
VVLGGGKLGLKHGRFLTFSEDVSLANLFVTMLNCLGVPAESFADSTGELAGVLQS